MARSGLSFPSKPTASRKTVWTSGVSASPQTADTSNLSTDAQNPNPTSYPYNADSGALSPSASFAVSYALQSSNVGSLNRKPHAKFTKVSIPEGNNFILRDIAKIPFNTDIDGYVVRFRIISKDRNRFSTWSPFYKVKNPYNIKPTSKTTPLFDVAYTYTITSHTSQIDLINIMWDKIDGVQYVDIFEEEKLKTDNFTSTAQWTYIGRQLTSQMSNIIQIRKSHSLLTSNKYRYSFHRPQSDPEDLFHTGNTIDESYIYQSRIFIAIETP